MTTNIVQPPDLASAPSVENERFDFDQDAIFAKTGPLWDAKFLQVLRWNEYKLYKFLANHFNPSTGTSYPNNAQWDNELSIADDRSARSLAQAGCASLGLIEKWFGPYKLDGKTHYGNFWRMPYVLLPTGLQDLTQEQRRKMKKFVGLHFDEPKQPLAHSLLTVRREQGRNGLPWQFHWVADRKTHLSTPEVTEDDIAEEVGRRMGG